MGWAAGLRVRAPVLHRVAGAPKAATQALPHEHWGTKDIKLSILGFCWRELRVSLPSSTISSRTHRVPRALYTATTHLQTAPESGSTGRTTPLLPRQ